jgi:hypothetical protein
MCGVRLSSVVSAIKLVFSIPPQQPTPNITPNWNVASTDPLPVVRFDRKAGERSLDVRRYQILSKLSLVGTGLAVTLLVVLGIRYSAVKRARKPATASRISAFAFSENAGWHLTRAW